MNINDLVFIDWLAGSKETLLDGITDWEYVEGGGIRLFTIDGTILVSDPNYVATGSGIVPNPVAELITDTE